MEEEFHRSVSHFSLYTDKKENQILLIYKEIQIHSYMTNGLLIYGANFRISSYMRKTILIYDFATAPL
jgi:hypothetical protein